MRRVFLAAFLGALVACSASADGTAPPDDVSAGDAATTDAGKPDAAKADASQPDAGQIEAGKAGRRPRSRGAPRETATTGALSRLKDVGYRDDDDCCALLLDDLGDCP